MTSGFRVRRVPGARGFGRSLMLAAAFLLLTAMPAAAQPKNPLEGIQGKADTFGGAAEDEGGSNGLYDGSGSASIPIGGGFHLQFDGLIGFGGNTNWAIGGHIYWLDPKIGLIDLNISFLDFSVRHVTRIGIHGQFYWGEVTIKGNMGWQIVGGIAPDSFYGDLSASWYPIQNAVIEVGGAGYRKQGIGFAHFEYRLPLDQWIPDTPSLPPVSIFMNGGAGNNRYWHVVVGIRVFFGACGGSLVSLQRTCGSENLIQRSILTLRPVRTGPVGSTDDRGGGGGSPFGPGPTPSDRRLKTDIVRLATLPSGIGLYRFRYIWGGPAWVGVMAQEVLMVRPDAVSRGPMGYLRVDYSKLGLRTTVMD